MSHILAIDQGTSSSRALVFNLDGRLEGVSQLDFDNLFPADGWVEQDPEVLWSTTLAVCRGALEDAGVRASSLTAIGITNQRETTLLWDAETGECVHNAIIWQDRRTVGICNRMRSEGLLEHIRKRTGLLIDPYFSATKLAWLLEQDSDLRARAQAGKLRFGTVDTFLIWRLTGGKRHLTDATNASRTMLFDIHQQCWDETLLQALRIPRSLLPEVVDSAGDFGSLEEHWLGASVPILGVAGDQQAAMIGQGCFTQGMTKSTYGTGCFVMTNTGTQALLPQQDLLATVGYRIDGVPTYALEGSIFAAGVAVKWLRDQLGLIEQAGETELLAGQNGVDTGGVYVIPAFTGLGAPHWNPDVRGMITGLTLNSGRAQIVTATLQSVVYQTSELVQAMQAEGASITRLRVDGGMSANNWLCQFLADILNVPVDRPEMIETTALGAATLAALASGHFSSLAESARLWRLDRQFEVNMQASQRQMLLAGWQRAVAQALNIR
ncbi:MAG: glycerol kinase GlpK [Proteobacteria bacterium]|nr:glycerol kinase GlpK [Pseudomonadota bacterium]